MKKVILLILHLWIVFGVFGQENTFYRKYNLSGMNGGLAMIPTNDGGFVAAGQHEGNGSAGGCDIYIYRVDECGNRLWFKLIGEGAADGAKSIKQLANGDFLVSGHYDGGIGFVAKVDGDGNLLWLNTYPGLEWVMQATQAANGDIICVAKQPGVSCVLMRLDQVGSVLWSKSFSSFGQMPLFVSELASGDIIFLSTYGVPGKDLAVSRTDGSGNIIWSMGYGFGYSDLDHTSWSCAATIRQANNSIVMTATSQNQAGLASDNILVLESSLSDGSVNWSKAYGGPGSDQSRAIITTPQGYAICGNSDSFPIAAGANSSVTESMNERNILLLHIDFLGNILWSRQYGANARDKGIGVGYNADGTFTISAYTASPYFGNADGSMDPLFIKTDSVGLVTCQSADCPLTMVDISSNATPIGTNAALSLGAVVRSPVLNSYIPTDVYQCQDCYTVPYFELSDSIICVNDTVFLYNLTTIGLRCFQEWQIEGISFDGNLDTLAYTFSAPGLYQALLTSSCGASTNTYNFNIRVSEVIATGTVLTDYNGYGVSCFEASDGMVEIVATGGYFPTNQGWEFDWTPDSFSGSNIGLLAAGNYSCLVTDEIGCRDTALFEITQPTALLDSLEISTDFSGYNISCYGENDGEIQAVVNFPSGGVAAYNSQIIQPIVSSSQPAPVNFTGLNAGSYTIQTIDANGCLTNQTLTLVQPNPIVPLIGIEADTCAMGVGAVDLNAQGGVSPYTFIFNGISNPTNVDLTGLSQGIYSITVEDANGCAVPTSAEIDVIPGSDAIIGAPNPTVCMPDQSVFFDLSGPYSVSTGTWDFGDGVSEAYSGGTIQHTYLESGDYQVQLNIEDIHGCTDVAFMNVHIKPDLRVYVPNTFTPNNDFINDVFQPIVTGASKYKLTVFNRWGDIVFETENVDAAWNGSPSNQNLSSHQEVYNYRIEVEGECGNADLIVGSVILLR